ncbi:MAG TPA: hypothetical protein VK717_07370 [Opitutaceae bacterium]|jgi:hypothetical protein|nr:hypothetical protein [Opitutaceae bacterium]
MLATQTIAAREIAQNKPDCPSRHSARKQREEEGLLIQAFRAADGNWEQSSDQKEYFEILKKSAQK